MEKAETRVNGIRKTYSKTGPLQNHGHKMAASAAVFRDTLISVIPAGVCVMARYIRKFRIVFL